MANANVGVCVCPCCDLPGAAVRRAATKNAFAYVICEDCGYQGFARSAAASEKILAKITTAAPAAPAAAPEKPAPAAPAAKTSFWDIKL